MSGLNKVILIGHLGKDPELRQIDQTIVMASFPLATSEWITGKKGRVEQTEWHNVVMWRGMAESAAKLLKKGKLVCIEGKLRTRQLSDKDSIKKYMTEIIADNFILLGNRGPESDFV